jgi:hypothetical protein
MNTTALSAEDVQAEIRSVWKHDPSCTHTHESMRAEVPEIELQRIGVNMDALAKAGVLELVRQGWDGWSKTKQYRLAQIERKKR